MNSTQSENGIILRIDADYIYEFNTASLEFTCPSPFEVYIGEEIQVIEVSQGVIDAKERKFTSQSQDGTSAVKLLTLGVFNEVHVRPQPNSNSAVDAYGMQYFPFVSSRLKLDLRTVKRPLHAVLLNVPESFRVIWYRRKIVTPNNQDARIQHSYAVDKAKYIFTWNSPEDEGIYSIDIPIRLGGQVVWHVIQFPQYYFYVSLIAIALASLHPDHSVLFAAIVGSWLFIMGYWAKLQMPQRNTIAAKMYMAFLWTSLFWGVATKFSYVVSLILGVLIWYVMRSFKKATEYFSREGRLPKSWEKLFFVMNSSIDRRNRQRS